MWEALPSQVLRPSRSEFLCLFSRELHWQAEFYMHAHTHQSTGPLIKGNFPQSFQLINHGLSSVFDLCFLSALCLFIFLLMTSYIFTGEFSFPTLILETTSVRCLELVANGGRGATDPSQVNQSIPREMCPAEVWR